MNAYPDSRWVGLKFTFEFLDVEAQEDATPASSAEDELSQIGQTLDGGSDATPPFISLEHNRWGLGQHFVPVPESIEGVTTGWVCSPLSNRVTTFASQPYLEFRFSEPHSSIGFTVVFEESTGEHASKIKVETFNAGGTVVSSKTVDNHSATAAVELPSLDDLCPVYSPDRRGLMPRKTVMYTYRKGKQRPQAREDNDHDKI